MVLQGTYDFLQILRFLKFSIGPEGDIRATMRREIGDYAARAAWKHTLYGGVARSMQQVRIFGGSVCGL